MLRNLQCSVVSVHPWGSLVGEMQLACGVKLGHVEDGIVLTVGLLSGNLRVDVWVTNRCVVVLVVIVSVADVIAVLAESWASVAKVVVGIWTITEAGMSVTVAVNHWEVTIAMWHPVVSIECSMWCRVVVSTEWSVWHP